MKIYRIVHLIGITIFFGLLFFSCNNDEIEDLNNRIKALELQKKDSVILGDLQITSQESMNIMAGRGITNILGTLFITNCVNLTPLSGLKAVEALYIDIPVGLNSLEGLNDLTAVNYLDLNFSGGNDVDISALDGVESLNGISLGGNLPSISWFDDITDLESINIHASTPSMTLSGFGNLVFANYINISNWDGNLNIQGFENLTSVIDLSLHANTLNIGGFNNIQSISYLNLGGNTLNFSGLNGITSLDYLYLGGNSLNISGLNGLASLNYLSLYAEDLDISGLDKLTSIESLDVFVQNSASGLNSLERVDEYLFLSIGVYDEFLTGLTTAGFMNIYSYSYNYPYSTPSTNSDIKSFADFGFSSLQSIKGLTLNIPSLESIDGFDFSNSTLQEFSINNCPLFTDISALSTYSGSIGYLNINNTKLVSLNGLENVTGIDAFLSITGNFLLEDFCAIRDILDLVPINQRYIQGNLFNPASAEDISGCELPE